MNASGVWCQTGEELLALKASSSGAMVSKSATLHPRIGNPLPRYVETFWGSINSMGLPNEGIHFYLDFFEIHPEKPHFLSVAGLSFEENIQLLKIVKERNYKGWVELNLSCPNIPGKPQVGYDFETTEQLLQEVFEFFDVPLGVKLPPYFDFAHFDEMAKILNKFPLRFVTCINSIGNGLVIDKESDTVVIKPKNGFGGIGGAWIKPTALANVRAFYERLRDDIAVIGCGGVTTGRDVFEHILCGASLVQIGTQLNKEGLSAFERIADELKEILENKGYTNIEDARGKLKTLE